MKVEFSFTSLFNFPDLFKKFFPDEYVKRFLQADVRSDGRGFNDLRKIEIYTCI